ncbi:unnamed protein product [Brachionus calyciflorus]|uniref:Transmembrane protein 242 n=1 Tax=Brachionus calyciflorus TaxID=104777 RepID=A0A813V2K9_9BILA|nr:unnamed protein product [Brachionus calyciflorus]
MSDLPDKQKSIESNQIDIKKDKADKIKAGIFFAIVSSLGILSGFGLSVGTVKKRETKNLSNKKLREFYYLQESGAELARRALFRATLYSVGGFSLFCFSIWKLSGAKNFEEFRYKIGSLLPNIKRNKEQEGRTEFKSLTELFQYLIDEDNRVKNQKK